MSPATLPAEAGLILALAAALALVASLDEEAPPSEAETTAAIFALHGYV